MADKFAARKCNRYTVVSTLPDMCFTPKKPPHGVPAPYIISVKLSTAENVVEKTYFNGDKAFVFDQSKTPKCKGDMPGKGKGIKSNTTGGECVPTKKSPSVNIEKKSLVREGDTFDMNNKNTVGKLVTTDTGSQPHITDDGKINYPQHELKAWDPKDDSYWHKMKTIWGYRKFDAKPIVTLDKFLETTIEAVLPVNELEQAVSEGAAAVAAIKSGNVSAGIKQGATGVGKAAVEGVYNKTVGKFLPRAVEKKVEKVVGGKDKTDGGKSKKKEKENLKCGEGGTYLQLKKKLAAIVGIERDHVPSGGALKKRALELNGGEELSKSQLRKIENIGETLAIPKEIHASHSPTFKGRNTSEQMAKDASNLEKAAERDLRAVKKGLPAECKQAYEKYAKKIRKIDNKEYDRRLLKVLKEVK